MSPLGHASSELAAASAGLATNKRLSIHQRISTDSLLYKYQLIGQTIEVIFLLKYVVLTFEKQCQGIWQKVFYAIVFINFTRALAIYCYRVFRNSLRS